MEIDFLKWAFPIARRRTNNATGDKKAQKAAAASD